MLNTSIKRVSSYVQFDNWGIPLIKYTSYTDNKTFLKFITLYIDKYQFSLPEYDTHYFIGT